jgi:serine/threonine protein phosphatase PrpC
MLSVKAAVISRQGMRPSMQDTYHLDLDFGGRGWIYGGVYDGHGGSYAAKYAAQKLHSIFLSKCQSASPPGHAFIESYETVSRELEGQESGTTASTFLIKENDIFSANAGDSRMVVINRAGVRQLSVDHRLSNREELDRVVAAGALINYPYVMRDRQGIMTTRAIGDAFFSRVGVISTPSTAHYVISGDDLMLIVASDGLWDTMSNAEVSSFAGKIPDPDKLLEALAEEVLDNRLGTDNLTIIAVSFIS